MSIQEPSKKSGVDYVENVAELAGLKWAPIVVLRIENLGEERPLLQIIENELGCFTVNNTVTPEGDGMNNERDRQ